MILGTTLKFALFVKRSEGYPKRKLYIARTKHESIIITTLKKLSTQSKMGVCNKLNYNKNGVFIQELLKFYAFNVNERDIDQFYFIFQKIAFSNSSGVQNNFLVFFSNG